MATKKKIDRENLIVDDIINENSSVNVIASPWANIKGFYLNNAKDELKLITLFSLLNKNQKEEVFDFMIELLEQKFLIEAEKE